MKMCDLNVFRARSLFTVQPDLMYVEYLVLMHVCDVIFQGMCSLCYVIYVEQLVLMLICCVPRQDVVLVDTKCMMGWIQMVPITAVVVILATYLILTDPLKCGRDKSET